MDAKILSALRAAPCGVSGAELARHLGMTRAGVWGHIEQMRASGYEIEASPHIGYRLLGTPDALHADDLYSRLGQTRVIGREIKVFRETTSTNDVAARLARGRAADGTVVFAEAQTKGRGRMGRTWLSPAGKGLWFTVLLRPNIPPQQATQLTVAAATALTRAITLQTGIVPEIKWPNDILIRGRKLCGILTELSADMDFLKEVLLGIGMDVNLETADFPPHLRKIATSLQIETGQPVNRAELAVVILRELDRDYELVKNGQFEEIAQQWRERCSTLDRQVAIRVGNRVIRGRAESLDDDGALLVRGAHGHLERIVGGDVTIG
ncbi:MAG TPA: biotin--[acetyl-CoA-carboxylase] ligase [Candidatus Baltobacteraceae bacterium]|nr:biotin--[acetyl-CoA-carboxylase] ligase [Candidatus Baltobacteraceae bacterium]